MTLFSAPTEPWSHRTRLVLAEKGIAIELVNVDPNKLPEDLLDLNPYHSLPTLVDCDLVLYDSRVIIEYLDERFPHPPLMPVDLATLAPLVKGSGEYLKSLPGRAVASLRARWMRWHKTWRAADGLYIEEIGSDALKAYRLTERAWSPTLLQQYARCPYRFALRGIFGLRPADRPAGIQRMDPAERGNLYHAVQFALLGDLRAAGLVPVNEGNLATAPERA